MNTQRPPQKIDGAITYWSTLVGAYSFFTREALDTAGLLDENFFNALEHLEHYCRIEQAGLTSPFGQFPDATNAEKWLAEIPGDATTSYRKSIRPITGNDWLAHLEKQLEYWNDKYAALGWDVPVKVGRRADLQARFDRGEFNDRDIVIIIG